MKIKHIKYYFILLIITMFSCDKDGITSYILKNNSKETFNVNVSYYKAKSIIKFNPNDQKTIAVYEGINIPEVDFFDTLILIPPLNKIFLRDLKNDSCWKYNGEPFKNGHYTNYFTATITDSDFK